MVVLLSFLVFKVINMQLVTKNRYNEARDIPPIKTTTCTDQGYHAIYVKQYTVHITLYMTIVFFFVLLCGGFQRYAW